MDLMKSMMISASGMRAQSARMRVISENIANQDSVATEAGGSPYQRKIMNFTNELNNELGIYEVKAGKLTLDDKPFGKDYDPGNPAADKEGYVLKSNVNGLIEVMDMKQAQRSYQSNLNAIETSRRMASMTLELLR